MCMVQCPNRLTALMLVLIVRLMLPDPCLAQGIHVFADGEVSVFGQLALNTEAAAVWSTDRSSAPGYFSATADAAFSGASDGTGFLIDGYVKYYRGASASATSFVFPVGQASDYRSVTISGTIPNNTAFATTWFSGDPGTTTDPTDGSTHDRNSKDADVISVLPQGFWDWQNLSGTASNMNISVSIPDVTAYALASGLILVGWDGSKWINMSGASGEGTFSGNWADGNTENSSLSGTWQAGISALAIGSLSTILPLTLESFTGKINGCSADLTWKTADEQNTSHFTVEFTTDGTHWQQLTNIAAQGNGAGKVYKYNVNQNERAVQYRLLMADRDGVVKYSPIVAVTSNCMQGEFLKVFPNPVISGSGTLQVQLFTHREGKVKLLLRNAAGQVLLSRNIELAEGYNSASIATGAFIAGTYLLSVVDEKGRSLYEIQKIIKK